MRKFARPQIGISRCIEFDAARWNGSLIKSEFVNSLKPQVEFIPVCPEVEIGLGLPRDPMRIGEKGSELRLLQPSTG